MLRFFLLALSGAAGTLSRYFLSSWTHQFFSSSLPLGTFVVNASGCLAIGFLGTLANERVFFSSEVFLLLMLGFLGAFTTCSSFTFETWVLLKDGEFLYAAGNVLLNLIAWFASLFLGVLLARFVCS